MSGVVELGDYIMAKRGEAPAAQASVERWFECFGVCFGILRRRRWAVAVVRERERSFVELRKLTKELVDVASRLGVESQALRDLAKNVAGANRATLDDAHIAVRDIRAALAAQAKAGDGRKVRGKAM